eukprot:jgi/Botrbrau1/10105/Bobra.20_2s0012.1
MVCNVIKKALKPAVRATNDSSTRGVLLVIGNLTQYPLGWPDSFLIQGSLERSSLASRYHSWGCWHAASCVFYSLPDNSSSSSLFLVFVARQENPNWLGYDLVVNKQRELCWGS